MNRSIIKLRPYTIQYQPIPLIGSYYDYIDVNNDKFLRKNMINYFREKTQKWLISDFSAYKCFSVSGSNVKKIKCNKNIKSIEEREYLFDLDAAARSLLAKYGRSEEVDLIYKSYSNFLRRLGD